MARVDPRDYLAHRGQVTRLPPADLSTSTLGVVALEIAPLCPLAAAQCVAEKVGALAADALAGHSASTLPELRLWAARWQRVRPDLRAFYEQIEVQTTDAGDWGLRRILTGQGTAPGRLRGELDRMWMDRFGTKPAFTLVPKVDL